MPKPCRHGELAQPKGRRRCKKAPRKTCTPGISPIAERVTVTQRRCHCVGPAGPKRVRCPRLPPVGAQLPLPGIAGYGLAGFGRWLGWS